jgi:hypothetical protein
MNGTEDRPLPPSDDEWVRTWQGHMASEEHPDRVARRIMAQVWRFDHRLFWRNAREYAAGIVLLVVFLGQLAMGDDPIGALVGIGSVGFVLGYLWWRHRGLQPLDPAADVIAYKAALLARIDDQIRLLRSVTYWYLLPLSLPSLWQAAHVWDRSPWAAATSLAVVGAVFALLRWLNVTAGVGVLLATRANVESMFPGDGR